MIAQFVHSSTVMGGTEQGCSLFTHTYFNNQGLMYLIIKTYIESDIVSLTVFSKGEIFSFDVLGGLPPNYNSLQSSDHSDQQI